MQSRTRIIVAVVSTIVIVAVTVFVLYYAHLVSSGSMFTVPGTEGGVTVEPTIIIVPVAEHGLPDMLHVALHYCLVEKAGVDPFTSLMTLFRHYLVNKSTTIYPDVVELAAKFNLNFTRDCVPLPSTVVLRYVELNIDRGSTLRTSYLNCSEDFYSSCLARTSGNVTACRLECALHIVREVFLKNDFLKKANATLYVWFRANYLLTPRLLTSLGTPELVYVSLGDSRGTVLVYMGLQARPGSDIRGAVHEALTHNRVPRDFAQGVRQMFETCLRAVTTLSDDAVKACFVMTSKKTEGNVEFYYYAMWLVGAVVRDVNVNVLRELLDLAEEYGFVAKKGSDKLYVIMFVSPTCPYCKTEILSLIESGVLKLAS